MLEINLGSFNPSELAELYCFFVSIDKYGTAAKVFEAGVVNCGKESFQEYIEVEKALRQQPQRAV